jgi:hypothetical protein
MEPRDASQQWPSGKLPVPAWTKTIAGQAYTVKRIGGDAFEIWREGEELGTFELRRAGAGELHAAHANDLSLEARTVVDEFLNTYSQPFEGAAKRD